jgi:hypothetical protein
MIQEPQASLDDERHKGFGGAVAKPCFLLKSTKNCLVPHSSSNNYSATVNHLYYLKAIMHLQDNTVRHGHLAIPPTRVPWQDTLISCDRATGKGIMLPFSTAYYHPSNRNSTQTNPGSEGADGGSALGPLWTARRFTLPFDPTSWWWSDDGNDGYDM